MEFLIDAWKDTLRLVPFLIVVYFLVSIIEHRYGDRMGSWLSRAGFIGPLVGAVIGCVPQCGFSVVAAALYVKRVISPGTLIAVFLSTSDEAIPVLLSFPDQLDVVVFLVTLKIMIAILAGIGIDFAWKIGAGSKTGRKKQLGTDHAIDLKNPCGCCSHDLEQRSSEWRAIFLHPLWHTIKIVVFLFLLTALFNVLIGWIGEGSLVKIFLKGSILQTMIASLIGLIPNCFASVFLTNLFVNHIISFGALVSGLSSAAGLGILVLAKENRDARNTLLIIGLLLLCSVIAGITVQVCL